MNKKHPDENDLIERYLLNQLSEEELTTFRLRLMRDKDLQAETEAARLLMKTINSRSKFRADEESEDNSKSSAGFGNKLIWLVPIVLLISVGLFFVFDNSTSEMSPIESENIQTESVESSETPPVPEENRSEPPKSEEKTESLPPTEKPPKKTPQKVETPTSKPIEKPIAAVINYDPNPALERYVGSRQRGNEYEFSIDLPEKIKSESGQITVSVSGIVETENAEIDDYIIARFYTNKVSDYEETLPVKTWELSFEPSGEHFRFSVEESVKADKGLYYFLVENPDEGVLFFVGKVRVE